MEKFFVSEVVADGEVFPVPGEPLGELEAHDAAEALRLFCGDGKSKAPIQSWDVDNMIATATVPRSMFRGRGMFYSRFRGRENVNLIAYTDAAYEAALKQGEER